MIRVDTVTIAQSGTDSTTVDLQNRSLVGIRFPTMTGTAVTMKESDGTPVSLGDDSAAFSIASPSGRSVRFASPILGIRNLQLISGGAEAAARSIQVLSDDYSK